MCSTNSTISLPCSRQITKHAAIVRDVDAAAQQIQDAFDELVSGTPRPVAIEVPADMWARPAPGVVGPGIRTMPAIDLDCVDAAAAKLRAAVNPLIWVGTGAQDAAPAVRRLAELLQAPVSTRRMGHGVLDEDRSVVRTHGPRSPHVARRRSRAGHRNTHRVPAAAMGHQRDST